MSHKCPTCGQYVGEPEREPPRRLILRQDDLLRSLREIPGRHVYRVNLTQRWAITYLADAEVAGDLVASLVNSGVLRRVYLGVDDAFGLDPTIDVDATVERRRQTGRKDIIVYAA